MRRIHEYTNLAKARVFYDGKGSYTFNFDKGYKLPNPYVFRGDHDSFVRFLMSIKAKDNKTWPRSVRGERYSDIADEIESGSDQIIYVWEHDFMRYINKKKENYSMKESQTSFKNILSFIEYIHKVGAVGRDWMHWEYGKFHITPIEDAYEVKAVNSVFDINPDLYKIKSLGIRVTVQGKEESFVIYNEDVRFISLNKDLFMIITKNSSTFELWAN